MQINHHSLLSSVMIISIAKQLEWQNAIPVFGLHESKRVYLGKKGRPIIQFKNLIVSVNNITYS